MSVSRNEANAASVIALVDLLTKVIAKPSDHLNSASLSHALTSQGALAAYESLELGIRRASLNTQKKACDFCLGGFAVLDSLRRRARESIASAKTQARHSGKRTKEGLLLRVTEQEQEIQLLLEDLQLLQRAFERRSMQARSYAESSKMPSIIALCRAEQREIDTGLDLRRKVFEASNVRPIVRP